MRAAARAMNDILETQPVSGTARGAAAIHVADGRPSAQYANGRLPAFPLLILWAHPRRVWGPGDCDVIPQADRVDPTPPSSCRPTRCAPRCTQQNSAVRDEQIEAFVDRSRSATVGRYPIYRGQWIVLTFDGRVPWVPLTTEEYLAFEERRLIRAVAETDRDIAEANAKVGQYDDSGPRQSTRR